LPLLKFQPSYIANDSQDKQPLLSCTIPASCSRGTGCAMPWRTAEHSPARSGQVKNNWS